MRRAHEHAVQQCARSGVATGYLNRMWLSKLGAIDGMTWVLHRLHARAAKKALAQSQGCKDDHCEIDKQSL